jgi:hypothetical protein
MEVKWSSSSSDQCYAWERDSFALWVGTEWTLEPFWICQELLSGLDICLDLSVDACISVRYPIWGFQTIFGMSIQIYQDNFFFHILSFIPLMIIYAYHLMQYDLKNSETVSLNGIRMSQL